MILRSLNVCLRCCLILSFAALSGLFAPAASAQTGSGASIPKKLTLADAEDLLLKRNLSVAVTRYQIEANRAARLIANYKPNPVLTIGAEQFPVQSPLRGTVPRFFATDSNAGAQPTYTFRVDKIFERGGKRELRTEQADLVIKASEAQMLDAARTQLFQLRQAFTNAMLARENLLLAESTNQQYEQTERLTQVRVENGDLAGNELYRVRSGRIQYQQAVLQAQTGYEQATRDVLNLLGARPDDVAPVIENISQAEPRSGLSELLRKAPLDITGRFDDRPIFQTVEELRNIALAERPDVMAARHTLEAVERGMSLARAQRARDLDLGFEYQRVGDDHALGVVLQVPLFVYNNQKAGVAQAEALRRAAETQLRQAELQAVTDVEKSFQAYQSARKVLDLYNSQNLTQVEKLRSISAYSFKEGAVSLFELLDTQRTYNLTLTAYNQARADYQMSLWQLEQAIGRPLH